MCLEVHLKPYFVSFIQAALDARLGAQVMTVQLARQGGAQRIGSNAA